MPAIYQTVISFHSIIFNAPVGQALAHSPHNTHFEDFFVSVFTVAIIHGQAVVHALQPIQRLWSTAIQPSSCFQVIAPIGQTFIHCGSLHCRQVSAVAMDFYPGKEGTHRTIVIIGTGNFAAVTARTASSLGHQNPFRRIDKPNSPTIDIFLLTTKKG